MNFTGLSIDPFAVEEMVVELESGERKNSTVVPETRASALNVSV